MASVVEGPFRYIVRAGGTRIRFPGIGKPYFPDVFSSGKCGNGAALGYATETVREAWYYYRSVKSTGPVGTITRELYLDTSEANVESVAAPLDTSEAYYHTTPGFLEIRMDVSWPHPSVLRKVAVLDPSGAAHQGYRGFRVDSPGNRISLFVDPAYPVPAGATVQIEHWADYSPPAAQSQVVQGQDELVVYRIDTQPQGAPVLFDDKSEECRLIQRPYLETALDALTGAPPLEFTPGHFSLPTVNHDDRYPTVGAPFSAQMYDVLQVEVEDLRDTSQTTLVDIQMGVFTVTFSPDGAGAAVSEYARWNRIMLAADPYKGPSLLSRTTPYDSPPGDTTSFQALAVAPADTTCAGCGSISGGAVELNDGWLFTQVRVVHDAGTFTLLAQAKRGASVREFPIAESTTMGPSPGTTTIGGIAWVPESRPRDGQVYPSTGTVYAACYVDWART